MSLLLEKASEVKSFLKTQIPLKNRTTGFMTGGSSFMIVNMMNQWNML